MDSPSTGRDLGYHSRVRSFPLSWAALIVWFLVAPAARAQWADRVPAPASDLVATDGAWAASLNPSALAFLESWEIAIQHQEHYRLDGPRTDAVYGATRLPFRFALGGGVEWQHGGTRGGRASLALAWADSPRLALGGALRWIADERELGEPGVQQRVGLDLGATWRPHARVGFALSLEDLLGPAGLARTAATVPFRAILAGQLRPLEDDSLILELAAAVDTTGAVGMRANASVHVERVGRIGVVAQSGDLRRNDEWSFTGTLSLDFGRGRVEAGAVEGPGGGLVSLGARIRGAERAHGAYIPRHIDDLEIRGGMSARRIIALVHRLEQDRVDPRVRGVFLRLRGTDMAMAYAQEIRQSIAALEESGKPVLCHLDNGSGSELYACGPAKRTLLDPAGGVRLLGPSIHMMLFGDALAALGVRTDFVRIGRYKTAVETYTRGSMSAPARRQYDGYLDDVQARFAADLARDRGVDRVRAQGWVDQGPYAAGEALEAGLVSGMADELAIGPVLQEVFGTTEIRAPRPQPERTSGIASRLGVVIIDGDIVDGDNVDLPILEIHQSGSRTLDRTIESMAADPTIRAIVVRIDSPGGSALASDQIWRALRRAAERKPVIASLGAVAASGGYYAASACQEIYADPTTVTGSIGIFFGKGDFSPLAERLGVHVEPLSRGRRAGADSLWRPFSADERSVLADKIRIWYRLFLRRVAEGRRMDVSRVHELAQGRIWSGDAARALGLVDHLGGFAAAMARARELGGLAADSPVALAPNRPTTLLDYLLGDANPVASSSLAVGPGLRRAAAMATSLSAATETPMALLPVDVEVR